LFVGAVAWPCLVPVASFAQLSERKTLDLSDVKEVKRQKSNTGASKNKLNRSAIFAIEVEEKLIKGIDRTIAFYKKQYRRLSKGSGARLNMMLRILDLNLEQATYVRNTEERMYDKRWNAWDLGGRKGREPKLNTSKSHKHWQEVIKQSTNVMSEYPRNKSADRVIFTKAFALGYLGREKEAAQIYTQLIQTYPNSSVAGGAYASLGDFYFDRNDFRNASSNYTKALKYKRSDRYLWSVFKLGWCSYNLGRNDESLKYWKSVVSLAKSRGEQGLKLREEAMRDMIYAFAETKDVKGAINYYRANGGSQYIGTLLTLLAQELADDGNYPEAIKTFRLFQELLPTNEEAPNAQKELLLLTYELGNISDLWKELEVLSHNYGPKSRWSAANSKDRKLVLETQKMIKEQMIYYAKVLHKRAQKTQSVALHKYAKVGYILFLKNYKGSKETTEVKFNLADIEFFLKDYQSAGRQYLEITLRGRKNAVVYDPNSGKPSSNVHKESAVYMVDAYARDFQDEFKKMKEKKPDFSKKEIPLSSRAKNYVKACSTYVKFYPKDQRLTKTCEVDIARIYYYSADKNQAKKYLWLIAMKYPTAKEGPEAVEFLIPLHKDNQKQLLEIADRLLKVPAYQKGELGEKLRALKRGAAKEAITKIKDPLKRARQYESIAKKNPRDPEADILLFKAGDDYLLGGEVPAAIGAYLLIVKKYPKSSQAQDALLNVAKLYEQRLDLAVSAAYFEAYAKKYPKDSKAKGAMAKSCDMQIATGSSKSTATCIGFATQYPNEGKQTIERLMMEAYRARRSRQLSDLITKYYLPKYKLSSNEKIIAYQKMYALGNGKSSDSRKAGSAILGEFKRSPKSISGEALRHVGAILFRNANASIFPYAKVKLSGGSVNRLQSSLERKGAVLVKLKSNYETVMASGDSFWSVAALHQLGVAHEQFALMLEDPPGIKGAKIEDVKKQLQPQVDAMKAEAVAYYKQAYKLIQEFKVYNEWSIKVINAFYRVNNSKLSFDDYVVTPDFIGSEISKSLVNSVQIGGN